MAQFKPLLLTLLVIFLNISTVKSSTSQLPYSAWMLESIISRQQGLANSGATTGQIELGVFQSALRQAIESSDSADASAIQKWSSYLDQSLQSSTASLLNASRDAHYPLDRFSIGNALLYQYSRNESGNVPVSASALGAIHALRTSTDYQTRNFLGGFWYYVYPQWSYDDGMFSLSPWYIHYAILFEPSNFTAVVADVVNQFDLLWSHDLQNDTGLLVHGYDASKKAVWANPVTGASPIVWGRALGWYVTGLVEALELLMVDESLPAFQHLRSRYVELAGAIAKAADPVCGAWWQVVTEPGRERNYLESSATALFTYSLLKGLRLGFVDTRESCKQFADLGRKAYEYMTNRFVVKNANGTLGWNETVAVCSLNSTATYEVSQERI
jgi:rhamnogalacturonyl hydrolase YesR